MNWRNRGWNRAADAAMNWTPVFFNSGLQSILQFSVTFFHKQLQQNTLQRIKDAETGQQILDYRTSEVIILQRMTVLRFVSVNHPTCPRRDHNG